MLKKTISFFFIITFVLLFCVMLSNTLKADNGPKGTDIALEIVPEGAVHVRQFGATGDGVTDDTEALRQAFKHRTVVFGKGDTYHCTSQIDIKNDVTIEGNHATVVLDSDVAYLFYIEADYLEIKNLNFIKKDSGFTQLNRAICASEVDQVVTDSLNFENFGTCIHNLSGKKFNCSNIHIRNPFGVEPHYGYGINTSAVDNTISDIDAINDDSSMGRHVIYLNGDKGKTASIKNIRCKNWNRNPIISAFRTQEVKPEIYISDIFFDNVNVSPMSKGDVGDIHIDDRTSGNHYLKNITAVNQRHYVVSSNSAKGSVHIDGIRASYIDDVNYKYNTGIVYIKYGQNHNIRNVRLISEALQTAAIIRLRENKGSIVTDIYNDTDHANIYMLRLDDADAMVGRFYPASEKAFQLSTFSSVSYLPGE